MPRESAFGAEPEQLRELLSFGLEDLCEQEITPTASMGAVLERPGGRIGRYKLISTLGEGGMGIVYLAEQAQPIKRQVALKVIKPGMDSVRVIARFEAERQALALLDHPNIAHVYDAGTTENVRPYFVMEYIKGMSITEYSDHHKLSIEDRLKLFLQVCHGVHHAHQKGIIHRDIKPSNILILAQGDQKTPKIIDFGVAKALAQPLTERTLVTERDQLFGTPEYMSPEQADMANEDIDTRSDIYSLGVLLYVLLTGVLPFDSDTLRKGGVDHIRQVIRETDPKTPSTRLTNLGKYAKKVAENRRIEVAALARCLHKELEWIPIKAMRKERAERYQSASELAEDIERYLNGDALTAGPPSTIYRFRKFVRKNRALVMGIAAVIAVLITGVVVSTIFAIKAERQARTSQAISDFLTDSILAQVDPVTGSQPATSLESILDVTSQRLDGTFTEEPLIEASIRYRIGRTYWHLGKHEAAEVNLRRAVELRRGQLGTKDPDVLRYMQELAWVYFHQTRYDQAELLLVEAINHMRNVLDEFDSPLPQAKIRLGWLYYYQGRYQKAEQVFAGSLELVQRRWGPDHPLTTGWMEGLGVAYLGQGRFKEAEQLCRKAIEIKRRDSGEEAPDTLNFMRWRGVVCCALGRYEDAEALFLKALEARRRILGDDNPRTLILMRHLGSLYSKMRRFDEAERLLIPALESQRRLFGNDDQETLDSMLEAAKFYRDRGNYEKAQPMLLDALHGHESILGPEHPRTLQSKHELAVLYMQQTRHEEAEQLLLEAFNGQITKLGPKHPHTIESIKNLIDLYKAWNKPEKAKQWRAKLSTDKESNQ